MSSDLKWNTHVRKTASKANQTLGVLRRNLKNCPREIKNMAYKSILRPKMEYAAPIWDPYTKDNIQLLEAVQRRAARFVCNKYSRHESVTSMLQDLDWPLLEQRRAESRLPSKQFLKTCKQMFDKMSSVSSKNVKTNL